MKLVTKWMILGLFLCGAVFLVWQHYHVTITLETSPKPLVETEDYYGEYQGDVLHLKGMTRIDEVLKIDHEAILLRGQFEGNEGVYRYERATDTYTAMDGSDQGMTTSQPGQLLLNHGVIEPLADGFGLVYKALDGRVKQLTDGVDRVTDLKYVLSNAHEKILYYYPKQGVLVTFDFKTLRHKLTRVKCDDAGLVDFENRVSLSPKGGYFSVLKTGETQAETTFSIYGSDSATPYAKSVNGHGLTWSPSSLAMAAFYRYKEDQAVLTQTPMGDRVGLIDFNRKTIQYTEIAQIDYQPFGQLIWFQEKLWMLGKDQDQDQATYAWMSYDPREKKWTIQPFPDILSGELWGWDLLNQDEERLSLLLRGPKDTYLVLGAEGNLLHHAPLYEADQYDLSTSPQGIITYNGSEVVVDTLTQQVSLGRFDTLYDAKWFGHFPFAVVKGASGMVLVVGPEL